MGQKVLSCARSATASALIICLLSWSQFGLAQQAETFKVRYVGGYPGATNKHDGQVLFDNRAGEMVFLRGGKNRLFAIPFENINVISADDVARRRVKETVILGVLLIGVFALPLLLSKKSMSYVLVEFHDPEGTSGGAMFRVKKHTRPGFMAAIAGKSGLKFHSDGMFARESFLKEEPQAVAAKTNEVPPPVAVKVEVVSSEARSTPATDAPVARVEPNPSPPPVRTAAPVEAPVVDVPPSPEPLPSVQPRETNPTFRSTAWGMTRDQVRAKEGVDVSDTGLNYLMYFRNVIGLETWVVYFFESEKLVRARYLFAQQYDNVRDYVRDFDLIKAQLQSKYGDPIEDFQDWKDPTFRTNPHALDVALERGHVVFVCRWEAPQTSILMNLQTQDDRPLLVVEYRQTEADHNAF